MALAVSGDDGLEPCDGAPFAFGGFVGRDALVGVGSRMASDHMVSHQSQKSDMPMPPSVVTMRG